MAHSSEMLLHDVVSKQDFMENSIYGKNLYNC